MYWREPGGHADVSSSRRKIADDSSADPNERVVDDADTLLDRASRAQPHAGPGDNAT